MAAKSRVARLESEIDKYRGDGNWAKVLDLARQLSTKSSHLGKACDDSEAYLNLFALLCVGEYMF